MRSVFISLILLGGTSTTAQAQAPDRPMHHHEFAGDSAVIRAIYDEALARGEAHENLRQLTKDIGHRLSGSKSASEAMQWGRGVLESYGADSVWIMPVMVPSWTRGTIAQASATIEGTEHPLHVTALGGRSGRPMVRRCVRKWCR